MTGAAQSFAAALAAEREGRGAEALELFRQTLTAEPEHTGALLGLARLMLAAGELDASPSFPTIRRPPFTSAPCTSPPSTWGAPPAPIRVPPLARGSGQGRGPRGAVSGPAVGPGVSMVRSAGREER